MVIFKIFFIIKLILNSSSLICRYSNFTSIFANIENNFEISKKIEKCYEYILNNKTKDKIILNFKKINIPTTEVIIYRTKTEIQ